MKVSFYTRSINHRSKIDRNYCLYFLAFVWLRLSHCSVICCHLYALLNIVGGILFAECSSGDYTISRTEHQRLTLSCCCCCCSWTLIDCQGPSQSCTVPFLSHDLSPFSRLSSFHSVCRLTAVQCALVPCYAVIL